MKKFFGLFFVIVTFLTAHAGTPPKLDKKFSKDEKMSKCAAWAKEEVKHITDPKKKASEFKEACQQCSSQNSLETSWIFSGKYKP